MKLLDGFEASISFDHIEFTLNKADVFINYPFGNEQIYNSFSDRISIERFQFVPDEIGAIFIGFKIKNKTNQTIKMHFTLKVISNLMPVWLGERTGMIDGKDTPLYDKENNYWIVKDASNPWYVIYGSTVKDYLTSKSKQIHIPFGYKIEYGGELANKIEVTGHLIIALMISMVLIFLILLFQFRNLKETGIVMLTIPLSLFGAVFGLYITGNNFGFTAFLGLISLSGIVVRNAIILIDHINELLDKGMDIRAAAIEAGKRRMRPIFLTAMAAAIGVLPMIISGSSGGPLASVLAFGVILSMLMALLTVPVLYLVRIKQKDLKLKGKQIIESINIEKNDSGKALKTLLVLAGLFIISPNSNAQSSTEVLNLRKVTEMALQNNHLLKIKQMQVNEKQQRVNEDKVKFFPMVSVEGNDMVNQNIPELTISKGSFGALPVGNLQVPLPGVDKTFEMGAKNTYNANAMVYQPVSQLLKINLGVQIAKTDLAITKTEQEKVTMLIKQAAEKLYYGLLIVQKQKEECVIKLSLVKTKLYDVEGAVIAGKATESAKIGLNAAVANGEQDLLKLNIQYDDYAADLKNLIGLPPTSILELNPISDDSLIVKNLPVENFSSARQSGNTDLKIAMLAKSKAEYAIKASKFSYLPDLGIMGGYTYQKGNFLYPNNNTFIGLSMKWNIQDMFSNTFIKRERLFIWEQAKENMANTQEQINTDIARAYRKLAQSAELIIVAKKVVNFRREDMKIQSDKQGSGLNIKTEYLTTKADLAKSEADLFAAQLGYRLAFTELQIILGEY